MNTSRLFFLSACCLLTLLPAASRAASISVTNIWINEIHYDNDGADENEGVEIIGPTGTDLSKFKLYFYNGDNNKIYDTKPLSGIIANEKNSYGTKWFAIERIQNGPPDGIALVQEEGDLINIIQFISYEGVITAADGPVTGMTSTDIGASEKSTQAIGLSLQLTGRGYIYSNFIWEIGAASPGVINTGQKVNEPKATAIVIR